jgi:PAS domain S-box-containing protein
MFLRQALFLIPFVISACISLGIGLYVGRRRARTGATAFAVYALTQGLQTVGYIIETTTPTLHGKMFWDDLQWLPIFIFPLAALIFTGQVSGQTGGRSRLIWRILAVVNAALAIFAVTGHLHGLTRANPMLEPGVMFAQLTYQFTVPALIMSLPMYLTLFYVIARLYIQSSRDPVHRAQFAAIATGLLIPIAGSILIWFGVTIGGQRDISPILFALGNLMIVLALFRYRLFDLIPVAREIVLDNLQYGVIVANLENHIVNINPAALTILGRPASALRGQDASHVMSGWSNLFEQYQPVDDLNTELIVDDSYSGESRHYNLVISPVRDRKGEMQGKLIVLRDITRRKQSEQTIQRMNEDLQQQAAALEAANAELGAFGHTIAHDLKAPLNMIRGYASLLHEFDETRTDDSRRLLESIDRATVRMAGMIDNLLLLAEVRHGEEQIEVVPMVAVAQAAVERFQHALTERGFICTVEEPFPAVLGNGPWLEEVFANLIGNAIKYIGAQTPDPRITVRGLTLGNNVRCEVQDNGLGIRPEDQTRLFEMFSRFHHRHASGSGLGLSIVARIVTRLGGEVGVESQPGEGSTFWFTLPAPTLRPDNASFVSDYALR